MGASMAKSLTFLALGCTSLMQPEDCPIRPGLLRCAARNIHTFTLGSLQVFVFAAHGGEHLLSDAPRATFWGQGRGKVSPMSPEATER